MERLLENIEDIRIKNVDGQYFVPKAALSDVVSESAVMDCLKSLGVANHEIIDLTDGILRGAQKCFAILVLIGHERRISAFFQRDSMQTSSPDDRLPYTSETLQHILGEEATGRVIKQFLEKQWEFATPILYQQRIYRTLNSEVIFPFLHKVCAGRGSMGTAWKIKLHPQCHRLLLEGDEVINKELECRPGDDMTAFQKELTNLSLLTYLKHPNIVPLHCSYIYRQRYNLVFAVADGGTLAHLLDGEQVNNRLQGPQFLIALAELASAINAMHNFTSEALDLSLSGCHHDLAPRNILIHGDTLLLADFGLSSFRTAEEGSLTTFKDVRGLYIAPECLIVDGNILKTNKIRRSSDIWSFGCILLEVLTYILWNSKKLQEFRDGMGFELAPGIILDRFHRGPNTPSPKVASWLQSLEENKESKELHTVQMVRLIRKMLSIDPNDRPRSGQVLEALCGISILPLAIPLSLNLETLCYICKNIEFTLGNMRFKSWLFAFNQLLDQIDEGEPSSLDLTWPTIIRTLKELQAILSASKNESPEPPSYFLVRYHLTTLEESLPPSLRTLAKEYLVEHILQNDVDQLGKFLKVTKEAGDNEDIGVLIAVKHLTSLADKGSLADHSNLVIDQKDISMQTTGDIQNPLKRVDIHSLALFKPTSETVLVEWLRYQESWADTVIGPELLHRLNTVASLFHDESTARIPGSLHCKGFFHNPSDRAFGVIHSLPCLETEPITLHGLLSAPRSPYRPLLEYRFQLAFDICHSIYSFHKVGWLHRKLHSMNVLFFKSKETDQAEWARAPRIIGFASGRENRLDSFSNGPDVEHHLRSYQHPSYLTGGERYREEFDYYSVGMLLLEVGLWATLSEITGSSRFYDISDEQFKRTVIITKVPLLRIVMGTRYMEATRRCLEGDFAGSSVEAADGMNAGYMLFKKFVMDRIPLID